MRPSHPSPRGGRGRRRHARTAATALACAVALLAAGCSGGSDRPTSGRSSSGPQGGEASQAQESYPGLPDELGRQRLSWATCQAPTPLQGTSPEGAPGEEWECATLTVPLDWDAPEGETIPIALIRERTTAPEADRIGSLVFNFGGPGGSGVATLPPAAEEYGELRAGGYDLVSFDPRGVGESAGVVCLDDAATDAQNQELTGVPDTPEEEALSERQDEEYIAACEANSGELLPHVTTANTARDMDLLRHVLGDERLNYFGISYGTKLGAVYAHLFPGNVGHTVLDGVVDPDPDQVAQTTLQTEGFQLALDHYLAHCAQQDGAECPTGSDPEAGNQELAGLLAGLEESPLPTSDPDGRKLTSLIALTAVAAALYSPDTWDYLTLGLQEAVWSGTGDTLLYLADLYTGRDAQGRYSNQNAANNAINCADDPSGMSPEEATAHEDELTGISPVFGEYMAATLTGCEGWPVSASETERPAYEARDAASPLLLVATTGDPATPYEGAARMQEAIGGPGVAPLLSFDGEGHSAYTSGDACVTGVVNAHLLTGEVPEDGRAC
ncbi:alpha/beta hydrolase [Streptomyces hoynatensis]|uniref:Alpha/beta hydrolase n=1 Tax=Streptomyces hoynatensis TaxID=1141874 RepID=A0A3A9YSY5_9ACTN|nr:alpha/beta hydrolase [Streptomyces hoynatensis]